jgi:hypothetical protein
VLVAFLLRQIWNAARINPRGLALFRHPPRFDHIGEHRSVDKLRSGLILQHPWQGKSPAGLTGNQSLGREVAQMLRLIVDSAFGAAILMSSAVFAQVPADPNNPNENLLDAMTPPA